LIEQIEITLRLLLAIGLGGLVGFERELTQKIAGLRTHILVCLGSCLFIMIGVYYLYFDIVRLVAAIITGVGFIGAGSIIAGRNNVQGVTTASSLWMVAGIGVAIGLGAYFLSILTAILVFFVLQIKRIERRIYKNIK
jgi:putative Mg2+ transporter-C (MgtC) family protein